ncbi:hypothetical protein B0J18DRAFT_452588 [Chaetomium sp. MPI-SDFR-AT-0129]|nr:hypothetical protein B0J18DRAFT_452588 [Chaetomium sp. MPI-SDFR-AT-0129]
MARLSALAGVVLALVLGSGVSAAASEDYTAACKQIEGVISGASEVVYPINAARYTSAQEHWFWSSSQQAACVLDAGSAEDVSRVLQLISRTRTPFAVISGGHSTNKGFSSTEGVHIRLKGLDQVVLAGDLKTVELGFGQRWTDVYSALQDSGVNVVGGRVPGPGVGGFSLGGGFSWKTNQHGLTTDTIESFNVVLPNGTITTASDEVNPDLFFALRGGLNRFGIVTSAVYRTHPQPAKVWGGLRGYTTEHIPALLNATNHFLQTNTDPRAQVITTLDSDALGVTSLTLLFYDGPNEPTAFEAFDAIPSWFDTAAPKTYVEFVNSFPARVVQNVRGTFGSFSTTTFTEGFLEAVKGELERLGKLSALHSGTMVSIELEPFMKYGQYDAGGAFPHTESLLPLNYYFAWTNPAEDDFWYDQLAQSIATVKKVAAAEGIYQEDFLEYNNYAIATTPSEKLYGAENLARLRAIRDVYDPERVMDLTGGFEI